MRWKRLCRFHPTQAKRAPATLVGWADKPSNRNSCFRSAGLCSPAYGSRPPRAEVAQRFPRYVALPRAALGVLARTEPSSVPAGHLLPGGEGIGACGGSGCAGSTLHKRNAHPPTLVGWADKPSNRNSRFRSAGLCSLAYGSRPSRAEPAQRFPPSCAPPSTRNLGPRRRERLRRVRPAHAA